MKQITVYQTDADGWFIGATVADESPREPGVYLMPHGAVAEAPPAGHEEAYCPRWDGKRWALQVKPKPADDAAAKLAAFLSDNPEVAALINSAGDV